MHHAYIILFSKRKTSEERRNEEKLSRIKIAVARSSDGSNNSATTSRDSESTDTDNPEESEDAGNDEEYVEKDEDDGKEDDDEEDEGNVQHPKKNMPISEGMRFSKRLAGVPGHIIPESLNIGLKNRLRQRPSVNTAAESMVVPDSEDESS